MPRLQPADRRSRLTDQAYESIRDAIVSGRFAMEERLVETELAEELGMSRAPIREALRRLSRERLVVERPNRGTTVAQLAPEDVVDLYNVASASR